MNNVNKVFLIVKVISKNNKENEKTKIILLKKLLININLNFILFSMFNFLTDLEVGEKFFFFF